jgi:hypothetical protein
LWRYWMWWHYKCVPTLVSLLLYAFTAKGYEGAYSTVRIKFLKKQPQKGRGTRMFTRMGYNHKKSDETVI